MKMKSFAALLISMLLMCICVPTEASAAGNEYGDFIVEKLSSKGEISFEDGFLTVFEGGEYRVSMKAGVTQTNDMIIIEGSNKPVTLILLNVNISNTHAAAITVSRMFTGDITIVLTGDNYLAGCGAISFVEYDKDDFNYPSDTSQEEGYDYSRGMLTISGGGKLTAVSKDPVIAAIGGGPQETVKNITISEGTIHASVVEAPSQLYSAAAIGGGASSVVENITITGGNVTAIGGSNGYNTNNEGLGSGIGASVGSTVRNITITGGVVNAFSGQNYRGTVDGIGTGSQKSPIENLVITGGSIDTILYKSSARNANGSPLYLCSVSLITQKNTPVTNAAVSSIEGHPYYGTRDVYSSSDSGIINLWLPAASEIVAINTYSSGIFRYYGNSDYTFTTLTQPTNITLIQNSQYSVSGTVYGCSAASVLIYQGAIPQPWNSTSYIESQTSAVSGISYKAMVINIPDGFSVDKVFAVDSDSGETLFGTEGFGVGAISEYVASLNTTLGGPTYRFEMPEKNTRIIVHMKRTGGVPEPTIITEALPTALVGREYNVNIEFFGVPTETSIRGYLPSGLSYSNGVISGTPTISGTFNFLIISTNTSASIQKAFEIKITDPKVPVWSGGFDYMLKADFGEAPAIGDYTLILIAYGASGEIIHSELKQNALSIALYGLNSSDIRFVRLFIWDLSSVKPLCDSYLRINFK